MIAEKSHHCYQKNKLKIKQKWEKKTKYNKCVSNSACRQIPCNVEEKKKPSTYALPYWNIGKSYPSSKIVYQFHMAQTEWKRRWKTNTKKNKWKWKIIKKGTHKKKNESKRAIYQFSPLTMYLRMMMMFMMGVPPHIIHIIQCVRTRKMSLFNSKRFKKIKNNIQCLFNRIKSVTTKKNRNKIDFYFAHFATNTSNDALW